MLRHLDVIWVGFFCLCPRRYVRPLPQRIGKSPIYSLGRARHRYASGDRGAPRSGAGLFLWPATGVPTAGHGAWPAPCGSGWRRRRGTGDDMVGVGPPLPWLHRPCVRHGHGVRRRDRVPGSFPGGRSREPDRCSPKTADAHVQHIYAKIGVSTRAQLPSSLSKMAFCLPRRIDCWRSRSARRESRPKITRRG